MLRKNFEGFHPEEEHSHLDAKLMQLSRTGPSSNAEMKVTNWKARELLARYGFNVLSWMDWYDFRLQNMWTQVITPKEARARGVEDWTALAKTMPSIIPIDLLTIPWASPLAITCHITLLQIKDYNLAQKWGYRIDLFIYTSAKFLWAANPAKKQLLVAACQMKVSSVRRTIT